MTKSEVAQHVSISVGPNNGITVGPDLAEGMQSSNKVLEEVMDARILEVPGLIDRLRTEGYSLHLLLVPGKMNGPLIAVAPPANERVLGLARAGVLGETVRALRRLADGKTWDDGTMAATIESELRDALNAVELAGIRKVERAEYLERENATVRGLLNGAREKAAEHSAESSRLLGQFEAKQNEIANLNQMVAKLRADHVLLSERLDARGAVLADGQGVKADNPTAALGEDWIVINAIAAAGGQCSEPKDKSGLPYRVWKAMRDIHAAKDACLRARDAHFDVRMKEKEKHEEVTGWFNSQFGAIDRVLSDPKCDVDGVMFPVAHRVSTLVKTVLNNWDRTEAARVQYSEELNTIHRLIDWLKGSASCPLIASGMNVAQTLYDWMTTANHSSDQREIQAIRSVLDGTADTFTDFKIDQTQTPLAYVVWGKLNELKERLAAAAKPKNSYFRTIKISGLSIMGEGDVYEVVLAFKVNCPARVGAIKKLLCAGDRMGGKDVIRDLTEARDGVNRAIELAQMAG